MAVTYGFYNALNHDRVYDAIQMSSIFDGIIRDGVFSTIGEALVCKASENGLVVNVGSGRAWFNHTWTLNDTDYPVEAEEAEVVLDRIDAIVLEVNQAVEVRANSIKFVKGTPSSNPVRPTLIHNAEVNQYALAYVSVRAGQTTIFQADITNVIGTEETPFITGLMQQVSIDTLLTQWADEFNQYFTNFQTLSTREFNTWMAAKVAQYTAWYAQMETDMDADFAEFDAWFQHMKDQLDSDAAGHLQAEIDALAEQAEKGSIVKVVTTDSSLFNKPVTINQGLFNRTSTFDANGIANFESIPYIGNDIQITATNGTLTAESIVTIPYFGKYEFDLEFWAAILDISTENSGLYNRTVTITKGGSTVGTTTFNGSGKAIFSVHSPGVYILSATSTGGSYFETSVEVTEETTYQITLGDVPDGAHALPTDDIETWIKCAGLVSDCTTLAEVLENEDLFDALLRDSNACKYMARSTTWAAAEGLVPLMTSNTTPSGTASASSVSSSDVDAFKAFNRNENDHWATATEARNNSWVAYTFPNAVKIRKVKITPFGGANSADCRIKNFKIQAYNGSNWIDLYTNVWNDFSNETQYFDFDNDNSYTQYRLFVVDNYTSYSTAIKELQFFEEEGITQNEDAMRRVGKYSYCKNQLLNNEDWFDAMIASPYNKDIFVTVPVMTSTTTPEGQVAVSGTNSYSGQPSNLQPYGMFNPSCYWESNAGGVPGWVYYKFTKKIKLYYVTLLNSSVPGIKSAKIQGSNDGSNWTDIDDFVDCPTAYNFYNKKIISDDYYLYYRLYIADSYYTAGGRKYIDMEELQFYGVKEPSTNLIHSAPNDTIYYKNGNESVTLCTTDENGVGELDFSTLPKGNFTFYSSVAKDPENLTEDYPRNLILTKTPMGGTTEVYMMPDAIRTLYWNGHEDDDLEDVTTANGWSDQSVGLTLSAPTHNTNYIAVSRVNTTDKFVGAKKSISAVKDFTKLHNVMSLSASSTANNAGLAGNTTKVVAGTRTKVFDNSISAKALNSIVHNVNPAILTARAYPYTEFSSGTSNLYGFWYSKKKKANLISAACDMVYYYDSSNNKRILAITDEFGFAQVDFSALPAGNLTLYSSVAKNPNDLSQPFSKIVNINPSQPMKVVLAPVTDVEKLLYWYGYELDGGFILKQPSNLESSVTYMALSPTKHTNYFYCGITGPSSTGYRGGTYVTSKYVNVGNTTSYKALVKNATLNAYSRGSTTTMAQFNNGGNSYSTTTSICYTSAITNPTVISSPISNITNAQFGVYQQVPAAASAYASVNIQGLWLE